MLLALIWLSEEVREIEGDSTIRSISLGSRLAVSGKKAGSREAIFELVRLRLISIVCVI